MIAVASVNRFTGEMDVTESYLDTIDRIILDTEEKLAEEADYKNPLDSLTTTVNLLGRKYESLLAEKEALGICTRYDKSKVLYQLDRVRDVVRECLELSFEAEMEISSLRMRVGGKK